MDGNGSGPHSKNQQNGSIELVTIDLMSIMDRQTCHINDFLFNLLVFFILLNKYNFFKVVRFYILQNIVSNIICWK